ncbi:MAG: outer membrane protein transport protein [Hyphomicrobiales bacterium]|nr:outer membrane protein transport protein [Hyphomicrobiales bacterium]
MLKHVQPLRLAAAVITTTCLASSAALATNGMFSHGFGINAKALAGAVTANSQDSLAAGSNPAGMLKQGNRVDVGVSAFMPDRGYSSLGAFVPPRGPNQDSGNKLFLVPEFGINYMLDDKSSIGLSVGGNGGMNTEYNISVYGGPSRPTGVDLSQMFIGLTYAREVLPGHVFGITPVLAVQRFKAEGLSPFATAAFSTRPGNVTDRGYDLSYGGGIAVGYQGKLSDEVTVGLAYFSRMFMTRFDKYSGLFAEQGDMDVPPVFNAGIAVEFLPGWTLSADFQAIFYGQIPAIANSGAALPFALGSDQGAGFGWDTMSVVKAGLQWEATDNLTLRAGISHNSQTFEPSEILFNVIAPGIVRTHASIGATYTINEHNKISFAYTRAFENHQAGTAPAAFGGDQVVLRMDQHDLGLSWTYSW